MRPEFITVGTVVNAHGVRGEVKVNPHGFDPAFIASFHTLYLNGQAVAVKAVRVHKSTVLLTLPGVGYGQCAGSEGLHRGHPAHRRAPAQGAVLR